MASSKGLKVQGGDYEPRIYGWSSENPGPSEIRTKLFMCMHTANFSGRKSIARIRFSKVSRIEEKQVREGVVKNHWSWRKWWHVNHAVSDSHLWPTKALFSHQAVRESYRLYFENLSQMHPLPSIATATALILAIMSAWSIASTLIPTV